jgi:hypothetical protein
MDNRVSFHIQHNAKPFYLERILSRASQGDFIDARQVELDLANEGEVVIKGGVQRTLDVANKLGLITKITTLKYKIEASGLILNKLALYKHDVYHDVIHYLFYAHWEINNHKDYWSWSYSRICDLYWQNRPEIANRSAMFGQLSAIVVDTFPTLTSAVGTETIDAVSNWLKVLNPPFFIFDDNNRIIGCKERDWFSPELALLAISYLYTIKKVSISTPILLDKTIIDSLTPLCLASHGTIMSMIEIASKTYPYLEIHTGEWGSSIILTKALDMTMIS